MFVTGWEIFSITISSMSFKESDIELSSSHKAIFKCILSMSPVIIIGYLGRNKDITVENIIVAVKITYSFIFIYTIGYIS